MVCKQKYRNMINLFFKRMLPLLGGPVFKPDTYNLLRGLLDNFAMLHKEGLDHITFLWLPLPIDLCKNLIFLKKIHVQIMQETFRQSYIENGKVKINI